MDVKQIKLTRTPTQKDLEGISTLVATANDKHGSKMLVVGDQETAYASVAMMDGSTLSDDVTKEYEEILYTAGLVQRGVSIGDILTESQFNDLSRLYNDNQPTPAKAMAEYITVNKIGEGKFVPKYLAYLMEHLFNENSKEE